MGGVVLLVMGCVLDVLGVAVTRCVMLLVMGCCVGCAGVAVTRCVIE